MAQNTDIYDEISRLETEVVVIKNDQIHMEKRFEDKIKTLEEKIQDLKDELKCNKAELKEDVAKSSAAIDKDLDDIEGDIKDIQGKLIGPKTWAIVIGIIMVFISIIVADFLAYI